eukprot:2778690-Rhodomonas_salina.2
MATRHSSQTRALRLNQTACSDTATPAVECLSKSMPERHLQAGMLREALTPSLSAILEAAKLAHDGSATPRLSAVESC